MYQHVPETRGQTSVNSEYTFVSTHSTATQRRGGAAHHIDPVFFLSLCGHTCVFYLCLKNIPQVILLNRNYIYILLSRFALVGYEKEKKMQLLRVRHIKLRDE